MPLADFANVLNAINVRGRNVIETFSGSELQQAAAEVERLSALLASTDPSRSGGLTAQLEAAKVRLEELQSGSAGRGDGTTPTAATASPVERVLFQMRTMSAAVNESTAEAERTLTALSTRAEEVTAEVQVKVSKSLAAILDPGSGAGVSGNFSKSGQFLGGGLSYERARGLVDLYTQLQDIDATKLNAFQQFFVSESLQKTAQQFSREFGSKLGDIRSLAKQLREYMAATAKNDRATGPTSGTLTRPSAPVPTSSSLAMLRWSGDLR